jgi:transcriptional regulator with XRE-family HTH domain
MDFKTLLQELKAAGLTQKQVADYCGCSQVTVSDLARGVTTDPSFSIGRLIVALHARKAKPRRKAALV